MDGRRPHIGPNQALKNRINSTKQEVNGSIISSIRKNPQPFELLDVDNWRKYKELTSRM